MNGSSELLDSRSTEVTESPKDSSPPPPPPPPTQTLHRYFSIHHPKLEDNDRTRMSSDEIAEEQSEKQPEEEKTEVLKASESQRDQEMELLKSTESLEDYEEPLLCHSADEHNILSQPSSPLAVDDSGNNSADETDAWISCNRSQSEEYKPVLSIASSCSTWYEDADEKPCAVGAGLANLGNTCFFNAVLQCFTHTVPLVQGLYLAARLTPCSCNGERFCLSCALQEHIELSLSSTGKIVSPTKFVDNLNYFSSSFQRFQQEDAHEFLQCFLDRLESSLSNLKAADVAFSLQNDNLVKQVFGGRVVSKLRCCNCNHCSDTYEPSVDLSLEIEDAYNLSTALQSFTKVEHIEDEEMKFTCDQCKQKVSVEKQLMLDQTPPICALHLKRFKNDGSYVEKIDKHVEFPLELNLEPYTCSNQSNNEDLKYNLYAVVVHAAFTSSCGHYYCYIRSAPDTWYKFDDSKVTKVSEAYVLSEEAYILFYARQGTPWFSNFMETYKPSLDPNLSNTSPKSVLENVDHTSTSTSSPDTANNHAHNINGTNTVFSDSFTTSEKNKAEVSGAEDHPSQFDTTMPPGPNNSSGVKVISPLAFKEYGSNHRLEVQKNADSNGVFSTPPLRPSGSSGGKTTFDIDEVLSPSTPPRSPGLDLLDDEDSEVVFAPKPEQLKLVEKPSYKRRRSKDSEDFAKQQALKQCKKMPGARGSLLLAALETSKSENSLKAMAPPAKNRYSRSSEPLNRNLATSSFRR